MKLPYPRGADVHVCCYRLYIATPLSAHLEPSLFDQHRPAQDLLLGLLRLLAVL